jgi:hypothetical protein
MAADQNVGVLDARLRIMLGVLCVVVLAYHYYFAQLFSFSVAIAVGIGALVFLTTGLIRFCPVMRVLGVNTAASKSPSDKAT